MTPIDIPKTVRADIARRANVVGESVRDIAIATKLPEENVEEIVKEAQIAYARAFTKQILAGIDNGESPFFTAKRLGLDMDAVKTVFSEARAARVEERKQMGLTADGTPDPDTFSVPLKELGYTFGRLAVITDIDELRRRACYLLRRSEEAERK